MEYTGLRGTLEAERAVILLARGEAAKSLQLPFSCEHCSRYCSVFVALTRWTSSRSSTTAIGTISGHLQQTHDDMARTEVVVLETHLPVTGDASIPIGKGFDPLVEGAVAPDGGGERGTEGAEERHISFWRAVVRSQSSARRCMRPGARPTARPEALFTRVWPPSARRRRSCPIWG